MKKIQLEICCGTTCFMLGADNLLDVSGGKIYDGTAPSGGSNVYVYGGNGLVSVSGGEITGGAGHVTIAQDTGADPMIPSELVASGGYISGGVNIATGCGVTLGGDAKIGSESYGLRLPAEFEPIDIKKMSDKAEVYITAEGAFAKAAKGSESLDIAAYANKQIKSDDKRMGNIIADEIDGTKWLVVSTKGTIQEVYAKIAADAGQMTTDGVFNGAEGEEPGIVVWKCLSGHL